MPRHTRWFAAVPAAVASLSLVLTACSSELAEGPLGEQLTASDCQAPVQSGPVSHTLALGTQIGAKPATIKLPEHAPLRSTQRTLLNPDDTATLDRHRAVPGDVVTAELALYDATTGQRIYQSAENSLAGAFDFIPVYETEDGAPKTLGDAVRCAAEGEQYITAFTPEDVLSFGSSFNVTPGAGVILVTDVHAVSDVRSQGASRPLPNGFPAVTVTEHGTPAMVMPPNDPPADFRFAERYEGTGAVIRDTDTLVIQTQQATWDGAGGDTWGNGPQVLGPEGAEAPAWRAELTGLRVGTMVVMIDPAADQADTARVNIVKVLAAE